MHTLSLRLAAVAALLLPAHAFAHAGIISPEAALGSTVKIAMTIPHGCDGAPVDAVDTTTHAAPVLLVAAGGAHDHGHETAPAVTDIGDLEISGAFTRATLPNAPVGGGYLTITNKGTADDRLVSVNSAVAGSTEVHQMKMEGDVMKMTELPDGLVIPAGGSVSLAPGGYHIMFMELKQAFTEGESIAVTLTFENAGSVEVQLPVGAINADEPSHDMTGM